MERITATASRLVDGKALPLDRLVEVAVTSTLASPAQSLELTAAVDAFPGELGEITANLAFRGLFTGRVDRQTTSLSRAGRLLTVEARSKGALLLDNEAVPCTLTGVQLTTLFRRCIQPYGFLLIFPGRSRSLPAYTVAKGISEWEALCGFTRRVYDLTPYVTGDQVVVDRPRSAITLNLGSRGLPFVKLEHVHEPYQILSKVVLRDEEGHYRSAVHNSSAAYYGVQRKRYVVPAGEFADDPGLDANQRIRRSMHRRERLRVVLPGIADIHPGREVNILDDAITRYNLLAEEVVWRQDPGGVTTTLTLVSSLYYSNGKK